jgi:hypothetical protein
MRMTAFVACVPLMAGALAAQTTNDRVPGQGGQGLTLMVLPPSPETHQPLRYVLNEPAYVAAFLVYPGAGVRLLYPLVNQPERLHDSGYNTDELIGASFDNDIYNVVLGPTSPGPVYLYVVASKHPLDVARYVHRPMTLASAVGEKDARSFYSDVAFDALLNNAISLGDDDSWDSDMYILWPNADLRDARAFAQVTRVVCADGTARMVPFNYPFAGCPGQQHIRPLGQVERPVQRTAMGEANAAAAARATSRPQLGSRSFATAPTVLPTIIGDRATAEAQRTAHARDARWRGTIITAANGDGQAVGPAAVSAAASAAGVEVFDGSGRVRRGNQEWRDADGSRTRFSAEKRQEWREQHPGAQDGRDGRDARVGGSPSLPPNPRLAPNPGLSPNPGMSDHQRSAPRFDEQRSMRSSSPPPMRSAPTVGQQSAPSKGTSMPPSQAH